MATIREITGGLSIQGIADQARQAAIWADDSTVRAYVEHADEGKIICRGRGRHSYPPPIKTERLHFTGMTRDGLYLIRRLRCTVCKSVSRIEEWDVRHKGNTITKCELFRAYPGDYDDDYLGEPGQGRMKPRQIQSATATIAMAGTTYKELRAEIVDARVHEANRLAALRETQSVGA